MAIRLTVGRKLRHGSRWLSLQKRTSRAGERIYFNREQQTPPAERLGALRRVGSVDARGEGLG